VIQKLSHTDAETRCENFESGICFGNEANWPSVLEGTIKSVAVPNKICDKINSAHAVRLISQIDKKVQRSL